VPRIDERAVGQLGELIGEGVVQLVRVPAVMAIAGAGVEQRVAAEQRPRVAARQDADMRHRVARRVEAFQFDAAADLDHVAGVQAPVDALNLVLGIGVRQELGAGRRNDLVVAAGMVAVMVRVEDLGDVPTLGLGRRQAFLVIERVDRQRLAGLGTGDQVIEVAPGIGGPDLFDDHFVHPTLLGEESIGRRRHSGYVCL
jgi:hypothetical protein